MAVMTSWLKRMVTVRRVVVAAATVAVAALLASLVGPVRFAVRAPNPGILAPGSQGSVPQQHPWWDPGGWFSSGSQAPSSHAVPGAERAIAHRPRVLREVAAPPARRVREVTAKRT